MTVNENLFLSSKNVYTAHIHMYTECIHWGRGWVVGGWMIGEYYKMLEEISNLQTSSLGDMHPRC